MWSIITVTLFNLYLITTTLSMVAQSYGNKCYIVGTTFIYYLQHFMIASLLYLFLSGFSNEELTKVLEDGSQPEQSLVNVLRNNVFSNHSSWMLYYYYYRYVVQPWQSVLTHSTAFLPCRKVSLQFLEFKPSVRQIGGYWMK